MKTRDSVAVDVDLDFWSKYQVADWLGVSVRYVEKKARDREWPSFMFNELKFSAEHRAEILARHERKSKRPQISADLLTVEQAAKKMGVSRSTAYRLVASGELTVVDISGEGSRRTTSRVSVKSVNEWIQRRTLDAA